MKRLVLTVNANVCSYVFGNDSGFSPVRDALFGGCPKAWSVGHGGKPTDELQQVSDASRALVALDRAGRTVVVTLGQVEHETASIAALGSCLSDDQPVIAVARLSKARTLWSHDQALIKDFTNTMLIANPRGRVHKEARHRNVLLGRWQRPLTTPESSHETSRIPG